MALSPLDRPSRVDCQQRGKKKKVRRERTIFFHATFLNDGSRILLNQKNVLFLFISVVHIVFQSDVYIEEIGYSYRKQSTLSKREHDSPSNHTPPPCHYESPRTRLLEDNAMSWSLSYTVSFPFGRSVPDATVTLAIFIQPFPVDCVIILIVAGPQSDILEIRCWPCGLGFILSTLIPVFGHDVCIVQIGSTLIKGYVRTLHLLSPIRHS